MFDRKEYGGGGDMGCVCLLSNLLTAVDCFFCPATSVQKWLSPSLFVQAACDTNITVVLSLISLIMRCRHEPASPAAHWMTNIRMHHRTGYVGWTPAEIVIGRLLEWPRRVVSSKRPGMAQLPSSWAGQPPSSSSTKHSFAGPATCLRDQLSASRDGAGRSRAEFSTHCTVHSAPPLPSATLDRSVYPGHLTRHRFLQLLRPPLVTGSGRKQHHPL